ncbi:MAG: Sec-independent protein translocase protein TatB [Pseudomonadales bacterium]
MFEIGFPELILIAIVGLLVIGPERLPEALRTLGLWLGRMRRSFTNVKTEIEKEIGMDEIRRQLHNEAVMEEMKRIERDVRDSVRAGETGKRSSPPSGATAGDAAAAPESPSLEPHPSDGQLPTPLPPQSETTPAAAAGPESSEAPTDDPAPSTRADTDTRRHG